MAVVVMVGEGASSRRRDIRCRGSRILVRVCLPLRILDFWAVGGVFGLWDRSEAAGWGRCSLLLRRRSIDKALCGNPAKSPGAQQSRRTSISNTKETEMETTDEAVGSLVGTFSSLSSGSSALTLNGFWGFPLSSSFEASFLLLLLSGGLVDVLVTSALPY